MLLSVLLFILSIALKLIAMTTRVAVVATTKTVDVATGTVARATRSKGIQTVQKMVLGLVKFFSKVIDVLCSLLLMGWVAVLTFLVVMILVLGGGWFWLVNLSDKVSPEVASFSYSQQHSTSQSGDNTGYNSGQGIPAVAASPSQVPDAILANIQYGMANHHYHYDWGGVGPDGYDCSGWVLTIINMTGWHLTSQGTLVKNTGDRVVVGKSAPAEVEAARGQDGASIRTASSFILPGAKPFNGDVSVLQPGDLLISSGHIGIYTGDGWYNHSSAPGASLAKTPGGQIGEVSDVGYMSLSGYSFATYYLPMHEIASKSQ